MAKGGNKRDFGEHATKGGNKHEFGEYATNGGNKRDFGGHATKTQRCKLFELFRVKQPFLLPIPHAPPFHATYARSLSRFRERMRMY